MLGLSAKNLVILASICFIASIIMQGCWIRSAYEGELSMYTKIKRQFQSALEKNIRNDKDIRAKLAGLIRTHQEMGKLSKSDHHEFTVVMDSLLLKVRADHHFDEQPGGFGMVTHRHQKVGRAIFSPVSFAGDQIPTQAQVENATRICLHCLVLNANGHHDELSYELVLFYEGEQSAIFKKMALFILGSFVSLFVLGLLFWLLLKKYGQERKLSEAKNGFINNLSHEMQTPVFAVQMANKLIREKTSGQEELQPLISVIEKETKQLKQHASRILELATLENEQWNLDLQLMELNEFIEAKRSTLEVMVQSRGGSLVFNPGSEKLWTRIDPVDFNNVLVSLTENAIKYHQGQPEIMIETGFYNEMVMIGITDNGVGIDRRYLPFVFDKFYRVPGATNNKIKGFGLGLSYVKQAIRLHGGRVDIKSETGRGTTVSIFLPQEKVYV